MLETGTPGDLATLKNWNKWSGNAEKLKQVIWQRWKTETSDLAMLKKKSSKVIWQRQKM